MSVETLAAIVTVAVAVAGGFSGLLGHWMARRAASGRVATTEAAVLWEQSQDIRSMLLAEKTKAEDQRDRLIDAYTQQVFPVLTEINTAVVELVEAVSEIRALVVRSPLEGGGHGEVAALASPDTCAEHG